MGFVWILSAVARRSAMPRHWPTSSIEQRGFCRAEGHLRIFARPRGALCQGPVQRAGVPGSRRTVALARLSDRARHGGGIRRRRPAPSLQRRSASSSTRFARSCSRSSTAIRCRQRSANATWSAKRARAGAPPATRSACIRRNASWIFPSSSSKTYFDLLPIHEKLRQSDFPTTRNYLKVTLCNIHDELAKRMDGQALAGLLDGQNA